MTRDDEVFVDGVWKKYNNYINSNVKDIFFKKHQYKNTEIKRYLSTATSFALGVIVTTGVVYASVAMYDFVQKDTKTDFTKNGAREYYYENMSYSDGIYYKRIYNYNEYIEAKNIWNNLVEMNENDFEESFVLIIAGQNYETTSLYISNIYIENNTTQVELKRKDKWSPDTTVISAKVLKKLDCENIKINNLPNIVSTTGKYKALNEITTEYSIEQALEDGCFVIENNEIKSKNKKQLDEFIEKKGNGVLRIYNCGTGYFKISDIQYNNGVININACTFKLENNEIEKIIYNTGTKIIKKGFLKNQYMDYILSDEIGNELIVCTIKSNQLL